MNSSRAFISASIVNTQNVTFVIDGTSSQGYNFDVNNDVKMHHYLHLIFKSARPT